MTIAVGVRAKDGVVLCADRQLTIGDAAKAYESKILTLDAEEEGWCISIAHAGGSEVAKLVKGTIFSTLLDRLFMATPKIHAFSDALSEVLKATHKSHPREMGKLQLLFAFGLSDLGAYYLYKSTGSLVRSIDQNDPMEIIGWGDSSLTRFLSESLYKPGMDVNAALCLSVYIVNRAEEYIPYCGGKTDATVIHDGRLEKRTPGRIPSIEMRALKTERDFANAMKALSMSKSFHWD